MKSLEKNQKIEKLAYNKYIQHSAVVDEPNDLITFAEKKVAKITKQQQAKLNALSIELKSGNETKISAAIKILQTNGHANILPELVELLKTKPSQKIRAEKRFSKCYGDTEPCENWKSNSNDMKYCILCGCTTKSKLKSDNASDCPIGKWEE